MSLSDIKTLIKHKFLLFFSLWIILKSFWISLREAITVIKRYGSSHMPPMYLRRSRRYRLVLLGRIRTCATGNQGHRKALPPACLRSWTWVNFAGMSGVKTGMSTDVAGHFCSHIGTVSQAAPAAMLQVHQRHMRTRLYLAVAYT